MCACPQGLGEESAQLASIVVPVIQLSTDMNQDAHIYLLEDGLHLWQAVLYHNTQISPGILELFPTLPPIVGKRSMSGLILITSS